MIIKRQPFVDKNDDQELHRLTWIF